MRNNDIDKQFFSSNPNDWNGKSNDLRREEKSHRQKERYLKKKDSKPGLEVGRSLRGMNESLRPR